MPEPPLGRRFALSTLASWAFACRAFACRALVGWVLVGWALVGWALVGWALVGCEKQYPNEKPVFRVEGVVTVDGVPQEGIQVIFHDENGLDVSYPTFPTAFTAADGSLVVSTYAQGDGAPAGTYYLTFLWGQVDPISMSYGGPDKLQGRYADAEKSKFKCRVYQDRPNNLGLLELTTR